MSATCQNYGTALNSSTCLCPPGFGNATCSQPACGGTIFEGVSRPLVPASAFPNITASACSCQPGWTGLGCNVCQTASACQTGFSAAGGKVKMDPSAALVPLNNTMICSTDSRVYTASQMSCSVINPTLQAVFPQAAYLNIQRSKNPALSPIPNVTSSGASNTLTGQLFYAGVEQFTCEADSCVQTLNTTSSGSSDYTCQNLKCKCYDNSSFCKTGSTLDLTNIINTLDGSVGIACEAVNSSTSTAKCSFTQTAINNLFGASGLALSGCTFGECVLQSVIDTESGSVTTSTADSGSKPLDPGVLAGLIVVGVLVAGALALLALGWNNQRKARSSVLGQNAMKESGGVGVQWQDIGYVILPPKINWSGGLRHRMRPKLASSGDDKVILDRISGVVNAGRIMAILGPSGSGKTTLVETLAGKQKSGFMEGSVNFHDVEGNRKYYPTIGFVPQKDVLPPNLTVFEAMVFAARLRLPESIRDSEKIRRAQEVIDQLGITHIQNSRIGHTGDEGGSRGRGISGGEMRRLSIGLELVASPDILILDEPTSGLDSVSAAKVARVLYDLAHGERPTAVIASIHQPSSQLYEIFDEVCLLAHGRALYSGPGGQEPVNHLKRQPGINLPPLKDHYNLADYLLEIASDPPAGLFPMSSAYRPSTPLTEHGKVNGMNRVSTDDMELLERQPESKYPPTRPISGSKQRRKGYAATFLTQFQVLAGREWKILQRDKTLFLTHIGVACILGVFCGGLYYKTGINIAGFQSRVGCLFFLGALTAFSSLSALYNVVESRPLFMRERSNNYYSPTAWLLSRFTFDVIPLRLIPTIIVATITYWMAGLAPDAAHFFKFLFILVLYALAMALWNFFLATFFRNGGIAILISALSALYQMTFAGFFVHLESIPPVLRWLQWLCPLKFMLEALSVNEVGSGLMISDTLQGVPVNISATVILDLLFGFGENNYYRDVLVLFAYIAGFALAVIWTVWLKLRERR